MVEQPPNVASVFVLCWRLDENGVMLVLMVHNAEKISRHGTKPSAWGLPGGGQNFIETIEEAGARECMQETGVHILENHSQLRVLIKRDVTGKDEAPHFNYVLGPISYSPNMGEPTHVNDPDGLILVAQWVAADEIIDAYRKLVKEGIPQDGENRRYYARHLVMLCEDPTEEYKAYLRMLEA